MPCNYTEADDKEFAEELQQFKKYLKDPNNNPYKVLTGKAKLKLDINALSVRPLLLNLASGTDLNTGWINLDAVVRWPQTDSGCDIVWDARKDKIPFADNTVDAIKTGELFLHVPRIYHRFILEDIYRVLKPGAQFIVNDINMEWVMTEWLKNPEDKNLAVLIWGGQHDDWAEFDRHCNGFTPTTFAKMLLKAGFVNLERVNMHNPENTPYELTYKCEKPFDI